MRRFFRSLRRKTPPPEPQTSAPEQAEYEGIYPEKYDHVVRVGVRVRTEEAPELRVLLKSNNWPFRKGSEPGIGPGPQQMRFTVHVPLMGGSLGARAEAVSRVAHACARAHIGALVVSATRPAHTGTALLKYHVVPDVPAPLGPVWRRVHRLILRLRSQGVLWAKSLTDTKEQLPAHLADHPGAGRRVDVTVTGPEGPVKDPASDPATLVRDLLLFLAFVVAIGTLAALYMTLYLPDLPTGPTPTQWVMVLTTLVCIFGVWLLYRRLPEGPVNLWMPLLATSLAPVFLFPLAHLSITFYLYQYGIAPGDADFAGYLLVLSGLASAPALLASAAFALGIFGFMHHFHLGGRGNGRFWRWLLALLIVALYAGLSAVATTWSSAATGAEHVAHYRAGGEPVEQFGIVPTPVCVDEAAEIDERFGPEPPTDQPVLHFGFANDTDFLWDPQDELTKIPSYSAPLTPVAGLDSTCPVPSEDEG